MGKEIILPWSCETNDIILRCIKWVILISTPLCLISFFILVNNNNIALNNPNLIGFLFMYGILGTMISWIYQLLIWDNNDQLPYFSCKCEPKNNENSVKK